MTSRPDFTAPDGRNRRGHSNANGRRQTGWNERRQYAEDLRQESNYAVQDDRYQSEYLASNEHDTPVEQIPIYDGPTQRSQDTSVEQVPAYNDPTQGSQDHPQQLHSSQVYQLGRDIPAGDTLYGMTMDGHGSDEHLIRGANMTRPTTRRSRHRTQNNQALNRYLMQPARDEPWSPELVDQRRTELASFSAQSTFEEFDRQFYQDRAPGGGSGETNVRAARYTGSSA